eukprot:CAMPEP_0168330842 /NCGR_PEP_ID=MMETSP0213-20121227/7982_1 /TAXON_ID=151035 /ORGANISM="Euplotes harpa, Strain FSP1.4" /LENGTH=98 /DNA_ID=CAMNT_0008334511 /DNA_START=234 /DNA_END=530 /DNA_ORIENTATION=+
MVEESDARDAEKEFDTVKTSKTAGEDGTNKVTERKIKQPDRNVINYFSMKDEDIAKERNKIKDADDDIFKDLAVNERKLSQKATEHGWDDEELNIVID